MKKIDAFQNGDRVRGASDVINSSNQLTAGKVHGIKQSHDVQKGEVTRSTKKLGDKNKANKLSSNKNMTPIKAAEQQQFKPRVPENKNIVTKKPKQINIDRKKKPQITKKPIIIKQEPPQHAQGKTVKETSSGSLPAHKAGEGQSLV